MEKALYEELLEEKKTIGKGGEIPQTREERINRDETVIKQEEIRRVVGKMKRKIDGMPMEG